MLEPSLARVCMFAGFVEGCSCWVSVDIDGGETNFKSRDNFTLTSANTSVTYRLTGTTLNPSWTLEDGGHPALKASVVGDDKAGCEDDDKAGCEDVDNNGCEDADDK